ncbi:hypothetical protein [Proteus mirabilis]|uniref:hypothetical protein n=1 Tax=Proteus mirabilis TaxID=584 RepID=UPI0034D5F519
MRIIILLISLFISVNALANDSDYEFVEQYAFCKYASKAIQNDDERDPVSANSAREILIILEIDGNVEDRLTKILKSNTSEQDFKNALMDGFTRAYTNEMRVKSDFKNTVYTPCINFVNEQSISL